MRPGRVDTLARVNRGYRTTVSGFVDWPEIWALWSYLECRASQSIFSLFQRQDLVTATLYHLHSFQVF